MTFMSNVLDEINRGKRVEHMLETLTGQARNDFILELAFLICAFNNQPEGSVLFANAFDYLVKRYPATAVAPVREFDPFNL